MHLVVSVRPLVCVFVHLCALSFLNGVTYYPQVSSTGNHEQSIHFVCVSVIIFAYAVNQLLIFFIR